MKPFLLAILFLSVHSLGAQTPCDAGMAGPFECNGYDLISQIPLSTMNSVKANDSWGWTDAQDGKEYAIICLNEATAFIDISDPLNPVYLGQLPGESSQHTTWRDAKTYNDHVFIVSEDTGHGMQVFDLTRLRNVMNPPVIFTTDALYTGFGGAHNIAINEDSGFAYAIGTGTFGGGPHFINIQDPVNPVAAGGYSADGYCHDAHVVIYDGPDVDYQGREILFGSNEVEVVIEDVTDKSNPITISTIDYTNINYTHQGWLTEDQQYFIMGDETDELNMGFNSRTIIFDMEDLDNPQLHFEYSGPTGATDHNGYVKGDKFYLANNAAGLRVLDISDIENQNMNEIGFFDSYPNDNQAGFNGSWSVYPFFESGHIVISDRAEGFLLVKDPNLSTSEFERSSGIKMYPNPTSTKVTIQSNQTPINAIQVSNLLGQQVFQMEYNNIAEVQISTTHLKSGLYFVTVNNRHTEKLIKE
jgi:choice-of-anchor B domain-containing protein